MVSRVSPGNPKTKHPWTRNPKRRHSVMNSCACLVFRPLRTRFSISLLPDSKPTTRLRTPASFILARTSPGKSWRLQQDQVIPLPRKASQSSRTRSRSQVNVSSSIWISLICGRYPVNPDHFIGNVPDASLAIPVAGKRLGPKTVRATTRAAAA